MVLPEYYSGDYAMSKSNSHTIIISEKSVLCVNPPDLRMIRLLPGVMKNGKMSYRSCEFSIEDRSLQGTDQRPVFERLSCLVR